MKKRLIIIGSIVGAFILLIVGAVIFMGKKTSDAITKQVNVAIDMNQVADGTYIGESDGGLVKVKVQVTVNDHKITDIQLLEHKNGKGKPAEAMLDDMLEKNTDDVDCVSGATASSKTIRNAVNQALAEGMQ